MDAGEIQQRLEALLGAVIAPPQQIAHGQVGPIYRALIDGRDVVVKCAENSTILGMEARMLEDLSGHAIAVPEVLLASSELLVMRWIDTPASVPYDPQIASADLLAKLHGVSNEERMYGYYYDTPLACFVQNNEQTQYNWPLFLSQMRLLPMVQSCCDQGVLDSRWVTRFETLCEGLFGRLDASHIVPSLLHGDLWSGNLLCAQEGIVLIDPAIYFGDREMELAFILLFHTFGDTFFDRYAEHYTLSPDFWEMKVPLYQLYPLLVHVALYGGSYVAQLDERLVCLGC
jgi:protein-ribulosamine 3-kinase